jgi:hypothetical protein
LRLLAQAYWQFSQEHSGFYQVMFGGEDSLQGMKTALSQVAALVNLAKTQNTSLHEMDTLETVRLVWAPLHGVIHLYLTGQIGNQEEVMRLFNRAVSMVVHSVFER